MDDASYEFFMLHYSGNPLVPQNIYPIDGELNVYQYPEFAGTAYYSAKQVPMYGIEIRVSTNLAMDPIVYQGFVETDVSYVRFPDFEAMIAVDMTYYWQIRYYDADSRYSPWSNTTSFQTASAFEPTVVIRPSIIYPFEGGRVSPVSPLIISSPFQVIGASDNHQSSDWQIANHPDFDSSHILAESLNDLSNLTSITFENLNLTGDLGFYARVRHTGSLAGTSKYSENRHALLKEFHTSYIIGIGVMENGVIYNIDEQGNHVNIKSDYFNNHPLYQFPRSIIADQYMRAIPETHVRCDAGQGGFAYRYWISPYAFTDSIVHPAFALSPGGSVLIGEYLTGLDDDTTPRTENLNSRPDCYVKKLTATADLNVMWLNTEEDNDHVGWSLMSVYEKQLLSLLMLIEFKTFNFAAKFNPIIYNVINNDSSKTFYRGIQHPFANSWETKGHCSEALKGIYLYYTNNKVNYIYIGDPNNLDTLIQISPFTQLGNSLSGFKVYTIHDANSTIRNYLQLLFIPKDVGTSFNVSKLNLPIGSTGGNTSTSQDPVPYSSDLYYYYSEADGGNANITQTFPFLYARGWRIVSYARLVKRL